MAPPVFPGEGFRGMIVRLAPPWLQRTWSARFLYGLGVTVDGIFEFAFAGVRARWPSFAPDDALPYIASDRGVVLGFDEPRASKVARLKTAIDDSKVAGSPHALLQQLAGYFAGHPMRIGIVTNRGTWHVRDEDGNVTVTKLAGNWDWDTLTNRWARFWVILWPLDTLIEAAELVGDGPTVGTAGATVGTTASPSMVSTVREITRAWKAAGRRCSEIVVALDPASFDPTSPPGAPMPDGTWGLPCVDDGTGVLRPGRLDTARYWDGTSHRTIETGT